MDERTDDRPRRHRSPLIALGIAATVLLAGGGGAYWATASAGRPGSGDRGRTSAPDTAAPAAVRLPGPVSRAAAEKLATALGVPGAVTSDAGLWKAGGGTGPTLQVLKAAPGSWSYARYGTAPHTVRGAAVSGRKALELAAPLLRALGMTDASTDASQAAGGLRTVTADPVVAGLRTYGWSTSLKIDPDGATIRGNGSLSAFTRGAVHPLIGSAQALRQLRAAAGSGYDHGIGRCPTVVPKESRAPGDDPLLPTVMPCVPTRPGTFQVRHTVFGLSAQTVAGRRALVPSWLFEVTRTGVKGTSVLAQPAISTSPGTPSASPSASPSGTSSGTPVDLVSYTARGERLTVRFWGGVCGTYTASATETAAGGGAVKVSVVHRRKQPERPCAMLAKEFTRTVRLDGPLGGRRVVDGSDGSTVPKK